MATPRYTPEELRQLRTLVAEWGKIVSKRAFGVHCTGQPLAADDVAAALADVVVGPPVNGIVEVAGPESRPIAEFVGRFLAATGDTRALVADPQARYFGAALDARGLNPGANPRLGSMRFEAWIVRAAARA